MLKIYTIQFNRTGELLRTAITNELAVFSRKDEAQERIDKYSIRPDDYSVVALNVTQDGACPYCKESLK